MEILAISAVPAIAIIAALYLTGNLGGVTTIQQIGGQPGFGQLVTLQVKGNNKYNGTGVNVNAELYGSDDGQKVSETSIARVLTQLSAALPNSFSGYVMIGNDNYESSTDRGQDWYYKKYPVSWSGMQGLLPYDNIDLYAEGAETGDMATDFYDSNTLESTANISIATGGSYTSATVRLLSTAQNNTGNPDFNGQYPLMLCFNETDSGDFFEIKPVNNAGSEPIPGFLRGSNVVSCWKIPTNALSDGATFDVVLYYKLNSGESVTAAGSDASYIIVVDKCYVRNDAQKWIAAYSDESDLVSDTDCGMPSAAVAIPVYLTGI